MELFLSLWDWLQVTGALTASLTPAYFILMKLERHVAEMKGIVENCPYCMRRKAYQDDDG